MSDENGTDLSMWFSTYGLLTAQRVLERFKINIEPDKLLAVIKDSSSGCHQLLRVPLKNIYNGIILQQVQDYLVYAQKLFVDYLFSGQDSKDEESPGANTREDIERERALLIEMSEQVNAHELAHQSTIAESQALLMKLTKGLTVPIEDAASEIENAMSPYIEQTNDMNIQLCGDRSGLYNLIIRVTEFIKLLPDYHIDDAKEEENRSSLRFDTNLGENL